MSDLRFATGSACIDVGNERTQEAPVRAYAMILEISQRLCIISCDTMTIPEDVLEEASRRVIAETGLAFDNLLICATHTHYVPSTIDIPGYSRDEPFCDNMREAIVKAAVRAANELDDMHSTPEKNRVELFFGESEETTVGMNSRYLLKDGSIAWHSYKCEDIVRSTGPYDPDLPVFSFRRPNGDLAGIIFNHSSHNLGTLSPRVWSPGIYGLVAQELERRHGGTTLFLPGAIGSTHNPGIYCPNHVLQAHSVTAAESVQRVSAAVEKGLDISERISFEPLKIIKRQFEYKIRTFNEDEEDARIRVWAEKYSPDKIESVLRGFRARRKHIASIQGQKRHAWLQTIRLGEIAFVAIPGQLFASLGIEIRRRSPFRWTYIIGLANDDIGYIGDEEGYRLGGYQLWPGHHSPCAPGVGEDLVRQALAMLSELK